MSEVQVTTPKEAIKQFCRDCIDGDSRHVEDCHGDEAGCPLWPVRLKEGKIPVRIIRSACLHCVGGSKELVFTCAIEDCPLYPYRMGKNEAHKNRPRPTTGNGIKQGITG